MAEMWDLYDKNRTKTGRLMRRGDPIPPGGYHLVVHVCIFNREGQMLIQQRQPFKQGWPNRWDFTAAGSAVAGDSSQQAAERECLEEIGYRLQLDGMRPQMTLNFPDGFDDYYAVQREVDLTTLKLQYEEVQAVRWASLDEILQMMDDETFVGHSKGLAVLLFDLMRDIDGRDKQQTDFVERQEGNDDQAK